MANENVTFDQKAEFMVCGRVKRRWVADSGKYATLDLEVPGRGQYDDIVRTRSFKDGPIEAIGRLIPGTVIKVFGFVGTEQLKDKSGAPVLIDGYKFYYDVLTVKKMAIDETSIASASAALKAAENQDNENAVGGDSTDDLPPGW